MNRMAIHYFATESIVNGLRRDVERPKLAGYCPMQSAQDVLCIWIVDEGTSFI